MAGKSVTLRWPNGDAAGSARSRKRSDVVVRDQAVRVLLTFLCLKMRVVTSYWGEHQRTTASATQEKEAYISAFRHIDEQP